MNNLCTIYNNEAIVSRIMAEIIEHENRIDITRLLILTQMILNETVINKVVNSNDDDPRTILVSQKRFSALFSSQFEELIIVYINSLTILAEEFTFDIMGSELVSNKQYKQQESESQRLTNITKIVPQFLTKINYISTEEMIQSLRIKL